MNYTRDTGVSNNGLIPESYLYKLRLKNFNCIIIDKKCFVSKIAVKMTPLLDLFLLLFSPLQLHFYLTKTLAKFQFKQGAIKY